VNTKLVWLLLGLLLAICAALVVAICEPDSRKTHTFTHPRYETMLQSADGIARYSKIIWPGFTFGILQFCFFTVLYAFSVNKQGRLKTFKIPLLAGLALNVLIFSTMVYTYWMNAGDGAWPLFGSFPLPTAIMFYGIWPGQVIFTVVYVCYFDKAIFTKEDQEKFEALLKSHRQIGEKEN
jgi:hypothetical protein